MATRTNTLAYGEKLLLGKDAVEPPTSAFAQDAPVSAPPVGPVHRPSYPTPSPWGMPQPSVFSGLVMGLLAAAAMIGGLATVGVTLAWSSAIADVVEIGLMLVGGALLAVGIAYMSGSARLALPES